MELLWSPIDHVSCTGSTINPTGLQSQHCPHLVAIQFLPVKQNQSHWPIETPNALNYGRHSLRWPWGIFSAVQWKYASLFGIRTANSLDTKCFRDRKITFLKRVIQGNSERSHFRLCPGCLQTCTQHLVLTTDLTTWWTTLQPHTRSSPLPPPSINQTFNKSKTSTIWYPLYLESKNNDTNES